MALTHYDEPRTLESDPQAGSLELLQEGRRADVTAVGADLDVDDLSWLPGFEVLDEDMTAPVVPMQGDEFRCGGCFLVLHQSMQATFGGTTGGLCRECALS
jgi:hypothetical protein